MFFFLCGRVTEFSEVSMTLVDLSLSELVFLSGSL